MEKAMKRPKSANRSISALVTEVIDNDLSLQDSLNRDYANISSIARLIQPQLENELNRSLNLDAIITAINIILVTLLLLLLLLFIVLSPQLLLVLYVLLNMLKIDATGAAKIFHHRELHSENVLIF